MIKMKAPPSDEDRFYQYYMNHWNETFLDFRKDLLSTDNNFHAFPWTLRLLEAGLFYCYVQSGFYKLKIHIYWRSWVPALAIILIFMVIMSYYGSLRVVIKERWCCIILDQEEKSNISCKDDCRWQLFHDFFVAYLGIMIIFNFLSACFRSPGVVLSKNGGGPEIEDKDPNKIKKWSSIDSNGGFCFIDPILNIAREQSLVRDYYASVDLSQINKLNDDGNDDNDSQSKDQYFPNTRETFCKKCNTRRPPRCHHCSICHRCILQFDHHCVWLNNCVGYNNHRVFLLTLLYLSVGCWYGCLLLYQPFLGLLKRQVNDHGWHLFSDNKTGFLDLPPVSTIFFNLIRGSLEKEVIIRFIFPLLTAVGLLQTIFFGYHVLYAASALTTLEYKILLDTQYNQIMVRNESSFVALPNIFCHGWYQNLKMAVGCFPLMFFPLQLDTRPKNYHILNIPKKET
mmetsp:Transcript_6284/g.6990  ORF Transcript_6284/g.6990 Transcript_6284/m.6990 type:complete len:454 (-) Transcript_6284:3916-5277(-)